ncbi:hypothetical protein HMPREF5505_0771 [Lactobacillus delbrueckii subsp. lactis DSM 20072]|nr:hypothetical protein HMPREF5505_0771 [Lactobacillus delbrueckii subsp. lactis DSM 20072]
MCFSLVYDYYYRKRFQKTTTKTKKIYQKISNQLISFSKLYNRIF